MKPTQADQTPATMARVYDYLLDGIHNFPADREIARKIIAGLPDTPAAVRANRRFLGRGVRFLASVGIRQFLDIGSGIPTEGNVHEIALDAAPDARVVYVDIDPVAVSESQELLAAEQQAIAINADMRQPESVLQHPQVLRLLDFTQPVALLMAAVLHFIPDDTDAQRLVEQFVTALPAGSYLLVSHGAKETTVSASSEDVAEMTEAYRQRTGSLVRNRSRERVKGFFTGLELVQPGVVWVPQWRPELDHGHADPLATDPQRSGIWCGVARCP